MKLGLRYETVYRYEGEVAFSPHEIRLFPRPDRFARIRRVKFDTAPHANVRFARDVFDNTIALCFFSERARELRLQLELDLDLEKKNPFDFILEKHAVQAPFEYGEDCTELLAAYRKTTSEEIFEVPGWERPTPGNARSTVTALVELNAALHESIVYERREEGAALPAEETLRLGRGACRDVAVLLAEILRQSGFAARLVSGYLREADAKEKRAEGSLHAWTEVFLPGAGWIGMDPTNGVFCNHNFIVAAVGLTPSDITPISGSYSEAPRSARR